MANLIWTIVAILLPALIIPGLIPATILTIAIERLFNLNGNETGPIILYSTSVLFTIAEIVLLVFAFAAYPFVTVLLLAIIIVLLNIIVGAFMNSL